MIMYTHAPSYLSCTHVRALNHVILRCSTCHVHNAISLSVACGWDMSHVWCAGALVRGAVRCAVLPNAHMCTACVRLFS